MLRISNLRGTFSQLFRVGAKNAGVDLDATALTANRTQVFQDKNGTLALLSDIPGTPATALAAVLLANTITGAIPIPGSSHLVPAYAGPEFFKDFALDSVLTPLVGSATGSFARASAAYRVNASGAFESVANDVLRYDYDPNTLAFRGVLIEGASTNNLLYSNDPTNAAWTQTSTTATLSATPAPDGGNAYDISDASGAVVGFISQTVVPYASASGVSCCVYIRKDASKTAFTALEFTPTGGTAARIIVRPSDGNSSTTGTGITVGSRATAHGANWWRVELVLNLSSQTGGVFAFYPAWSSSGTPTSSSAAATQTVTVWNFQQEAGNGCASSPIISGASVGTRAQDQLEYDLGSDWGTAGATFFATAEPRVTYSASHFMTIAANDQTGTANDFSLSVARGTPTAIIGRVTMGTSANGSTASQTFSADNNPIRLVATTDGASAVGTSVTIGTPVLSPVTGTVGGTGALLTGSTVMKLGRAVVLDANRKDLSGWLKSIAYYRRKISVTDAQALCARAAA